jgi:ubiquinone biosynthesis protein
MSRFGPRLPRLVENALIRQANPEPVRNERSLLRWVAGAVILGLTIGISGALTLVLADLLLS